MNRRSFLTAVAAIPLVGKCAAQPQKKVVFFKSAAVLRNDRLTPSIIAYYEKAIPHLEHRFRQIIQKERRGVGK